MSGNGQFRLLRILFLLLILLAVVANSLLTWLRTTDWDRPLVVAIYPINSDGSAASKNYIARLNRETFTDIEDFFAEEADYYRLALNKPFEVVLGPVLAEKPPQPPAERSAPGNVVWSLKIRYWAWRVARKYGPPADIQIFVLYHDPTVHPRLGHSLGLQKGLLGMVNAFASRRATGGNNLVITHELLHTVGARDKYDPTTNLPVFPQGYAEPDRQPLLPQELAEIMAGRTPTAPGKAVQARSLAQALIGQQTAREIHWIE
ncbi:MAG TPA: hypothetical protein ENI94_03670 [Gammaproteobacteria bacterium]|nr:hypothetical protein [Gammaproteobacteria bacterium]